MISRSFRRSLRVGAPVDVAPWGEQTSWDHGRDVGIFWEDPHDLFRVVVTFAQSPPPPASAKLQWWHSVWPERRIPRDHPAGAGESGWLELGDWYQGDWRNADTTFRETNNTWTFTFHPINAREFPNLKHFAARYRTTLKLRLLFNGPAPKRTRLHAYTDSTWQTVNVGIEWGETAHGTECWDGQLETFNGYVDQIAPLVGGPVGSTVKLDRSGSWHSTIQGTPDGIRARVWFAVSPNANTFDSTVITVRNKQHSFSFDPAPVAAGKAIYCPFYGVVVCPANEAIAAERRRRLDGRSGGSAFREIGEQIKTNANRTLYARVLAAPEQSLARAMREQPAHRGRLYFPLGTAGGRQRFGVNPNGSIFCVNDRIDYPVGRDTHRRIWGGNRLDYTFDLPSSPPTKRWIENKCLPISHTQWRRNGIVYTETAMVTRLGPGGLGFPDMHADDTAVLLVRLAGRNTARVYRDAHVTLTVKADGQPLPLRITNDLIYARLKRGWVLRGVVQGQTSGTSVAHGHGLRFFGDMPPGTDGAMILKIPFITLTQPAAIEELRNLDYLVESRRVKAFWQAQANAGAQITTPIPDINHFYRADVSHLLINCGREVGSDRMMARVGSFSYGVYGNESCMMITDLDRRGYHQEAERCLETFLHYQSTTGLPGDYDSHVGVFNGANGWESGGYNQHHGWIMWAMAEHYWDTGDRAWLRRNADKLILACHWISRERARTKHLTGLRRIERGLLPPGSLEDIGDWRCWLSNNVFSWWGLDSVARALADIHHPAAPALQAEANAYRRDILAAFHEAMVRSPLVPLRDGTWIPQIPSEVHRRGRTYGWITTTLEGSIYLLRTGLLAPNDPMAVNILKDYEDNLYLSERYGYSWREHGKWWFSRGGFSMQPNLLCSPQPYLQRDQIKPFLRAYFNAFAACYYPDTEMMCEHPLPDLGDWRGDLYKTSDESNSAYWLRLMFIEDEDNTNLYLGLGLPRAWLADGQHPSIARAATHFGTMSLRFESHAAQGSITAVLQPPTRRAPKHIYLRFRHPTAKPLQRVEVNGKPWHYFDPQKEWVELPPLHKMTTVIALYGP